MKTNIIFLTVTLATTSLILPGCSKSNKSGPAANNSSGNGNSPAASSATGGSAATGPTDLKLKWQVGKRYDMQMTVNQSTDVNVPGRPVDQQLKLTQGFHYSPLKDLDNGRYQVRMEFDQQNFALNQGGKEVLSFDSTQKTPIQPGTPAAMVGAVMGAMISVPLDFTIAADGTVERIDGLDTLTNRIAAALPDARQRASMQQLFDEETLKQYGSFSQSLPGHPVSIGDSWSSSRDVNNPAGKMTVTANFTFKNWDQHNDHNCAHLVFTGDIKTKTTSAATVGAVVKIQKGTIDGDVWFDPDMGMIVEDNSVQDVTLNITTRQGAFDEHMKENVQMSLLGANP